jgi:preprotein translocase subunit SecE
MTNPIAKIRGFLAEVVAELKKSAWPTRKELVDSTIVVVIAILILSIYVATADFWFVKIVGWLIRSTG